MSLFRFARPAAVRPLLAGALLFAAVGAHADPGGARWTCWPRPPEGISCWLARLPVARGADADRSAGPELLRMLRERPAALRGQAVAIPLNHAVPYDERGVARLAHLLLCGAKPVDCAVSFESDAARWTNEARDAFADAHDPLLARE